MKIEKAAEQLAELGHVTRLGIFRALVKSGTSGLPVADIQHQVNVPGSTLSHHINRMINVGLIKQVREGRVLRCFAQYDQLNGLIDFLMEECCSKEPTDCC
ncbi:helix-turn-helix transcriptional regulator [Psychrobium sp. 1_MG-2023]|uniref:ArsR/SmtB family transcription factor n=1 Tax=Psychrobium sp. 1_MG-2023 TaxID=3062624 RepID=UPI000C336F61|nr:helix-turn-helix domain-containing protein [Psychrobium sp. 1_MG-2023]MDP2562933.1 helix-turn-helix domain-containing protein [Psychrobium sp. 1_MG-2023]PKF54701.1 transcriptional regulator [Alteromonadales bacterium alter-6D02]